MESAVIKTDGWSCAPLRVVRAEDEPRCEELASGSEDEGGEPPGWVRDWALSQRTCRGDPMADYLHVESPVLPNLVLHTLIVFYGSRPGRDRPSDRAACRCFGCRAVEQYGGGWVAVATRSVIAPPSPPHRPGPRRR